MGDVIFVEDVAAGQLVVGDIATIRDPDLGGETLTHRVRAVVPIGDTVLVSTRGDANLTDESFVLHGDAIVGREVGRVPRVGSGIAWAGATSTRVVVGSVGLLVVAGATVELARRRLRDRRADHERGEATSVR